MNVLWVRVRDAITGALDSMTLADLAPQRLVALDHPTTIPTPDLEGALRS